VLLETTPSEGSAVGDGREDGSQDARWIAQLLRMG
jgi:hypothetical protein